MRWRTVWGQTPPRTFKRRRSHAEISDRHKQTYLVNPQFAHNDVVHSGRDLSPHIVVPAGVELQVNGTWEGEVREKLTDALLSSTCSHHRSCTDDSDDSFIHL